VIALALAVLVPAQAGIADFERVLLLISALLVLLHLRSSPISGRIIYAGDPPDLF